ncbi:hypothetical protein CBR_g27952 [Chara braunii]|uniref:Uncharacterized protein n=1 Tax=Chara braunii TaxID=69332 RepID=A0A388L8V0_CHABU|nr:hypothetical protein CBR_g27952 [Chara braunii]|eukprot:GBG78727.1 hypothetical protein CBR_g27952 [Chara braunii]
MVTFVQKQMQKEEEEKREKTKREEKKEEEEEEKAAREELNRLEIQKEKQKEDKEVKRDWRVETMLSLAKNKEMLKEGFEKMLEARLRGAVVTGRMVEAKAKVNIQSPVESEEEEEEEVNEDRLEKRKRHQGQTSGLHTSPQAKSPAKVGSSNPQEDEELARVIEIGLTTEKQPFKGRGRTQNDM